MFGPFLLQDTLPPELTNQAALVEQDPSAAAGDSAPAEGELRTCPSTEYGIDGDPGALLSHAVEAGGFTIGDAHPLQ